MKQRARQHFDLDKNNQTLLNFLEEHKDEIDYVMLDYLWDPYYAEIETDFYTTIQGRDVELYACFEYKKLDEEYSFYGRVDQAINFASSYGVWDGSSLVLDDGVLIGKIEQYSTQQMGEFMENENDLEDLTNIDVTYRGLFFYGDSGYQYFDSYPYLELKRHRPVVE